MTFSNFKLCISFIQTVEGSLPFKLHLADCIDSELGGDSWVHWWVEDCNFGNRPMVARTHSSKPIVLVATIEKLYEMVKEDTNDFTN